MIKSNTIIGREKEKDLFERIYNSGRSEFVAVYGRRRIGKTFLVREMFKDEFVFYTSGIIEGDASSQIDSFNSALMEHGYEGNKCDNWIDAFAGLKQILLRKDDGKRSVIFIDELPCLDTYDSKFLPALDWFWNTFGSARSDIMLIVCGSSTSWMLKNLLNNKKGLYNRLTRTIHLKPFKLRETELYANSNGAYWEKIDILKMYCIIGGVPLYWAQLDYSRSVEENVDSLFFSESPILEGEYQKIMGSIFKNPGNYTKIIEILCKRKTGMTRSEITEK
ncbi:MAG: ATP-binding protein, partial [Dorea sp.]